MYKEIQYTKENMQCFISCIQFNKKVGEHKFGYLDYEKKTFITRR